MTGKSSSGKHTAPSPKDNADYLIRRAMSAGISEPWELAHFMGQLQIESGGFRSMHENLNYSAPRLLEVFGPRVDRHGRWHDGRNGLTTLAEAARITPGGPQQIANSMYGGPWGIRELGNTEPGDGWMFHGRGYVQLTGRDQYRSVGAAMGLDLVNHPDQAADRATAASIAIHYWMENVRQEGLQYDRTGATRAINGGSNGLKDRDKAADAWQLKFNNGYLKDVPAQDAHEARPLIHPENRFNPLYPQTVSALHEVEHGRGIQPGEHSARLAAALSVHAMEAGLTRVDRVQLSQDGAFARAVQINPLRDESSLNRNTAFISTQQALSRDLQSYSPPTLPSSDRMYQAATLEPPQNHRAAVIA